MKITINVDNADKEIKLLDEANSLIERLRSIFTELNCNVRDCKAFTEIYSSDED